MEWDDLKHFLAVARLGSLTAAGLALNTSATTVGRRITNLETKLCTRLFDRKQTGFTLTDSGVAIRRKADEVERAILSLERGALGFDSNVSGSVRLTTTDDIATFLVAPHLPAFFGRFPEISIEISVRRDIVNLDRREADVALRTVRPIRGNYVIRRAGWWNLGLYAAKTYASKYDLRPGLRDLSKVAIITWTADSAHLRGGPWFAEHARGSQVALMANTRRIHLAACKAGLGVAILPSLVADLEPDLICLLPPPRVITAELWLVVHRDIARTARVRAVLDFLAEIGPKKKSR